MTVMLRSLEIEGLGSVPLIAGKYGSAALHGILLFRSSKAAQLGVQAQS